MKDPGISNENQLCFGLVGCMDKTYAFFSDLGLENALFEDIRVAKVDPEQVITNTSASKKVKDAQKSAYRLYLKDFV